MEITYNIEKGKKSIKKTIDIVDLSWNDFQRSSDISIKLLKPNGDLFKLTSDFVQIYTGKTDEEMIEWAKSCENYREFHQEIFQIGQAIMQNNNAKKKQ